MCRLRAFTLLELLLVLAIIALVSAVVAARLGGLRPTQAVDQAAQQVLDQAWRCRQLARGQALTVRLRLDAGEKTATVQVVSNSVAGSGTSDPVDALPVQVVLYEGADELTATYQRDDGVTATVTPLDVLFRADGRCDPPGILTLACAGRTAALRYPAGLRPPLRLTPDEIARETARGTP